MCSYHGTVEVGDHYTPRRPMAVLPQLDGRPCSKVIINDIRLHIGVILLFGVRTQRVCCGVLFRDQRGLTQYKW